MHAIIIVINYNYNYNYNCNYMGSKWNYVKTSLDESSRIKLLQKYMFHNPNEENHKRMNAMSNKNTKLNIKTRISIQNPTKSVLNVPSTKYIMSI